MHVPLDLAGRSAGGHAAPTARRSGVRLLLVLLALEAVALGLIVGGAVPHLLPARLATQVGHNSEAFALALLVTPLVVWWRAARAGRRAVPPPAATAALVVVLGTVGMLLLAVDEARVRTLNEPVFAAAALAVWLAVPAPRRWTWLLTPAVLVVVVVFFGTDAVRLQAELLVALALAPLVLEVCCRWVTDPERPATTIPTVTVLLALLLVPIVLMGLKQVSLGSFLDAAVLYAARGTEAFWGLLLVLVGAFLVARASPR